jgi:hypothetical protein
MKIDVSDVDEASASLQELRLLATEDGTHEARCIADAYLLYLDETAHPTMSGLYDSILQSWIAPLPRDVPHRIRQHKERLARRVAAEVMLASTRILHREPQPSTEVLVRGVPSRCQFCRLSPWTVVRADCHPRKRYLHLLFHDRKRSLLLHNLRSFHPRRLMR